MYIPVSYDEALEAVQEGYLLGVICGVEIWLHDGAIYAIRQSEELDCLSELAESILSNVRGSDDA